MAAAIPLTETADSHRKRDRGFTTASFTFTPCFVFSMCVLMASTLDHTNSTKPMICSCVLPGVCSAEKIMRRMSSGSRLQGDVWEKRCEARSISVVRKSCLHKIRCNVLTRVVRTVSTVCAASNSARYGQQRSDLDRAQTDELKCGLSVMRVAQAASDGTTSRAK